ncbi:hypothetical protein ACET3Z_000787 [Daucus carota]
MPSNSKILFWVLVILFIFTTLFTSFTFSTPLVNKDFTFLGDAHLKNASLILTQEAPSCSSSMSSPYASGVGRAFYKYPIRFLDFSTNNVASFTCKFSFRIDPSAPYCAFGDGLAFLITSNVDSVSLSDGYMGLPQSNALDSFLAVEFDTSFNANLGDINENHVSVDFNSLLSVATVDSLARGIDFRSGRKMSVWIEYSHSEKVIRVWVGYYGFLRPLSPLLVGNVDISKNFKEFMHVGFSASNGRGSAFHVVDEWRFRTSDLESSMVVDRFTDELEECLICFPGEDSSTSMNVDDSDHLGQKHKSPLQVALVVGGLVLSVISVIGFLRLFFMFLQQRKRDVAIKCSERRVSKIQANKVPKRLSLTEVRSATKGFSRKRIIGAGASAVVYEGLLPSLGSVAVKRFNECILPALVYALYVNVISCSLNIPCSED